MHGFACLGGEIDQADRIAEQDLSSGRHVQALSLANEERKSEVFLELTDARGDVGLDTVQLFGGSRDAAGFDDGSEDAEIGQVHDNLFLRTK
jgi:hypothetical protein